MELKFSEFTRRVLNLPLMGNFIVVALVRAYYFVIFELSRTTKMEFRKNFPTVGKFDMTLIHHENLKSIG